MKSKEDVNILFKQGDTDERILKSMAEDTEHKYDSEELSKALDKAKLVQKEVQVRGKNGQMHTRKQWVRAGEDQPTTKQPKAQEDEKKSKSNVQTITHDGTEYKFEVSPSSQHKGDCTIKVTNVSTGASYSYKDVPKSEFNRMSDKSKIQAFVSGKTVLSNDNTIKKPSESKSKPAPATGGSGGDDGGNKVTGKGKTINQNHWTKVGTSQEAKSQIAQMLASGKSREDCMKDFKAQGVTWKEHENQAINWMRAAMAMNKHLTSSSSESTNKPLKSTPKVESAKSKVEKSDDPTSISSIFVKNSMSTGRKDIHDNDVKVHDTMFNDMFSDYDLQDNKEVTVGKTTKTVKELRPYMSEVNSVLDEEYNGLPMVVCTNDEYLGNKIDTVVVGEQTYDVYDGGYNHTPNKGGYYPVINVNAPARLSNYMESLRKDIFSDALVEDGIFSTKKKALKFLGSWGTNWDAEHLQRVNLSDPEELKVRDWMLSKAGIKKPSVIGSDYTQLTTEEESGTPEGEAHNMIVGRLKSMGIKKPTKLDVQQAANDLRDKSIKTIISSYNSETIANNLALANAFGSISNASKLTVERVLKDTLERGSGATREQQCDAISKLCGDGSEYDYESFGDNVAVRASDKSGNPIAVTIEPTAKGLFKVEFVYGDGERSKETYDSISSVKKATESWIKKEEKHTSE